MIADVKREKILVQAGNAGLTDQDVGLAGGVVEPLRAGGLHGRDLRGRCRNSPGGQIRDHGAGNSLTLLISSP